MDQLLTWYVMAMMIKFADIQQQALTFFVGWVGVCFAVLVMFVWLSYQRAVEKENTRIENLLMRLMYFNPDRSFSLKDLYDNTEVPQLRIKEVLVTLEQRTLVEGSWQPGPIGLIRIYRITPFGRRIVKSLRKDYSNGLQS